MLSKRPFWTPFPFSLFLSEIRDNFLCFVSEYISVENILRTSHGWDTILINCNCEERRKEEEKGKKGKGIIVKITEFISLFMNLKERKEFPLYHSLQKSLHLSLSFSLETWNLKKERDLPEKSDLEQISTSLALQCLFKFAKRRKERPWTNNFFLSLFLSRFKFKWNYEKSYFRTEISTPV